MHNAWDLKRNDRLCLVVGYRVVDNTNRRVDRMVNNFTFSIPCIMLSLQLLCGDSVIFYCGVTG